MSTRKLLIINNDPKNLRILKNNFIDLQYEVDEVLDDVEAGEKIKNHLYDGILTEVSAPGIDGYQILAETQSSSRNQSCAVFFLTQKADTWNRLKSFKLGVKDYIIKPVHVKEIAGRVHMILNRIDRHRQPIGTTQPVFTGRLEELSLFELIEIFGLKRKTGILSLYNENSCSGRVSFKDGAVIHATALNHQNEEALYKMMAWRKGRFSMLFSAPPALDEIAVSNMGLLLQGAKRMQQREQLLRQLPSLNAVLVTTTEFKKIVSKKALAPDLAYFVSLFDGEHSLGRIIDESKYEEILTLERILKLYELGFLHTLRDFKASVSSETAAPPANAPALLDELAKAEKSLDDADLFPDDFPVTEAAEELLIENDEVAAETDAEDSLPPLRPDSHADSINDRKAPLYQDFSLDGYDDLMQPGLPPLPGESAFHGDLLYDMEVSPPFDKPVEGQTLDSGGDALFSQLDMLEAKHPADALLSINPESSFQELGSKPPQSTAPVLPDEPPIIPAAPSAEITQLEREWKIQERFRKARGGVIILSTGTSSRKEMVNGLTDGEMLEKKIYNGQISEIYLGTAEFKGGHLLNVVGIALDKEFAAVIDFFGDATLGFVIMVDQQNAPWFYYQYLLGVLREKIRLPFMVVVTQLINNHAGETLAYYRKMLSLRDSELISLCTEWTPVNSRRVLFSLFESYYPKQKSSSSRTRRSVSIQ